jgi:hypothetical protein
LSAASSSLFLSSVPCALLFLSSGSRSVSRVAHRGSVPKSAKVRGRASCHFRRNHVARQYVGTISDAVGPNLRTHRPPKYTFHSRRDSRRSLCGADLSHRQSKALRTKYHKAVSTTSLFSVMERYHRDGPVTGSAELCRRSMSCSSQMNADTEA